jgi:hypothetical protein
VKTFTNSNAKVKRSLRLRSNAKLRRIIPFPANAQLPESESERRCVGCGRPVDNENLGSHNEKSALNGLLYCLRCADLPRRIFLRFQELHDASTALFPRRARVVRSGNK